MFLMTKGLLFPFGPSTSFVAWSGRKIERTFRLSAAIGDQFPPLTIGLLHGLFAFP